MLWSGHLDQEGDSARVSRGTYASWESKELEPDFLKQREMSHILRSWTISDRLTKLSWLQFSVSVKLCFYGQEPRLRSWWRLQAIKFFHTLLLWKDKFMCPLQKAGLFDCLTNRIQRSHSTCFHTQALKLLGFHFLSLGMLTLEIQPPCCKEAQAAHDKTHVRGTEDPRTWFGLNS